MFLRPPCVRTESLVATFLVEDSVADHDPILDHLMSVTQAFFPSRVSAAELQVVLQPGAQHAGAQLPSRPEVDWRLGILASSVLNAAAHGAPRESASQCLGPVPGALNNSQVRKLELVGRKVNQQMVYRSLLCLLNAERGFRYG